MYSDLHYQTLISLVLRGDYFAVCEFIKRHHERGTNINPKVGRTGSTLLQLVVRENLTEAAILLLSNGAEVNTCDNDNNTPLYEAVIKRNQKLVGELLKRKANPFVKNNQGISASMILLERITSEQYYFFSRFNISFSSQAMRNQSLLPDNDEQPLDLSMKSYLKK